MRSIPGFVFAAVFALAVSCTPDSNFAPIHFSDDEPRGGRASGYEPADLLVGEYHYVLDYVATSRYESGSFHDEGSLWIEKIGENTVMMAGAWEAYGSVYGNTVQFDNAIETVRGGMVTYTFAPATYSNGTLVIDYTASGSMRYFWQYYPWEEEGTIVATKL